MHKALGKYISEKVLSNETRSKLIVEKENLDLASNSTQLLRIIKEL